MCASTCVQVVVSTKLFIFFQAVWESIVPATKGHPRGQLVRPVLRPHPVAAWGSIPRVPQARAFLLQNWRHHFAREISGLPHGDAVL